MKKDICEVSGCRKTATTKLRNNHKICEDHAKIFRRKKVKVFLKEVLIGHLNKFDICIDVPVKV